MKYVNPASQLTPEEQMVLHTVFQRDGMYWEDMAEATGYSISTLRRYMKSYLQMGYMIEMSMPTEHTKGRPRKMFVPNRPSILEDFPSWADVVPASQKVLVAQEEEVIYLEKSPFTMVVNNQVVSLNDVLERMENIWPRNISAMLQYIPLMIRHMEINDTREFIDGQPAATGYPNDRVEIYATLLATVELIESMTDIIKQVLSFSAWKGLDEENQVPIRSLVSSNDTSTSPLANSPAVSRLKARMAAAGVSAHDLNDTFNHWGYMLGYDTADERLLQGEDIDLIRRVFRDAKSLPAFNRFYRKLVNESGARIKARLSSEPEFTEEEEHEEEYVASEENEEEHSAVKAAGTEALTNKVTSILAKLNQDSS